MTSKYDEMTFGFILFQFTIESSERIIIIIIIIQCLAYRLLDSFHQKTTFTLLHDAAV